MNYVHHSAFKKLLGDWPAESLYRITVHVYSGAPKARARGAPLLRKYGNEKSWFYDYDVINRPYIRTYVRTSTPLCVPM